MLKHFFRVIFAILTGSFLVACSSQATASSTPVITTGSLDSAQAYLLRGDQESGLREFDQAIADYTLAVQLKPDFAEAYNNQGLAYALKSKSLMANAIADYSQAIQLRPTYAFAYNNRGVAYMASGHPEEALQDFNRALQLNPGFSQAHSNRGNYYWHSRQYIPAIIDLAQANLVYLSLFLVFCALIGTVTWIMLRKIRKGRDWV